VVSFLVRSLPQAIFAVARATKLVSLSDEERREWTAIWMSDWFLGSFRRDDGRRRHIPTVYSSHE
jgi:hypothetical protein